MQTTRRPTTGFDGDFDAVARLNMGFIPKYPDASIASCEAIAGATRYELAMKCNSPPRLWLLKLARRRRINISFFLPPDDRSA